MVKSYPYDRCVFINCPFDTAYKPILDAILFTIHDCGFIACTALEDKGAGQTRIDKLRTLIADSRFSIHDLSRVKLTKSDPLARLNMGFECGLALGAKFYGNEKQRRKDLLVLEAEPFLAQKALSDIAGQDACEHNNDPLEAIKQVRAFLARKSKFVDIPGHDFIQRRYNAFRAALPKMARQKNITMRELKTLDYLPDLHQLIIE
jgi:hypothetical protein